MEPIIMVNFIKPEPATSIAPKRIGSTAGPVVAAQMDEMDAVISDDPKLPIGPTEITDPVVPVDNGAAIEMTSPVLDPEIRPYFDECITSRNNDTDACTESRIHQHLSRKLKIPFTMRGSISTTVTFEVSKDGSIGKIHCAPKVARDVEKEIERVFRSLPQFVPGSQGGHPVAVYYQIALSMRQE